MVRILVSCFSISEFVKLVSYIFQPAGTGQLLELHFCCLLFEEDNSHCQEQLLWATHLFPPRWKKDPEQSNSTTQTLVIRQQNNMCWQLYSFLPCSCQSCLISNNLYRV